VFSLLLAVIATACLAHADKRVALLIGNGKYAAVGALANPRNDVLLLKKALDAAGFDDVKTAFDLGHAELVKALRAFTDAARDADIALVYYSGHGVPGWSYRLHTPNMVYRHLNPPPSLIE
jgi:uncharacterized protein